MCCVAHLPVLVPPFAWEFECRRLHPPCQARPTRSPFPAATGGRANLDSEKSYKAFSIAASKQLNTDIHTPTGSLTQGCLEA